MSLKEICIHKALDNLDMLGDVGGLDSQFLEIVLPHCTAEQLWNIEEATKERDLSKITDVLWMKCYSRKFGQDSVEAVASAMGKRKKAFKWKILYQRKLKEEEKVAEQCVKSLTAKFKAAVAQKASRKITQIDKAPPKRKRGAKVMPRMYATAPRAFKGRLMKKSLKECETFALARRPAQPLEGSDDYPNYVHDYRQAEAARRLAISDRSDEN